MADAKRYFCTTEEALEWLAQVAPENISKISRETCIRELNEHKISTYGTYYGDLFTMSICTDRRAALYGNVLETYREAVDAYADYIAAQPNQQEHLLHVWKMKREVNMKANAALVAHMNPG